ncbi:hypothetical protein QF047_000447 [Arthrobacter sp. W4I7]|nr:hypothetical protein [Arthrobacter sp. W4I7]
MTGVVSALVEAWQELRINKTRILLALVGVALSVAALTSVVGLGNLDREGFKASSEQNGGRAATLGIAVFGPTRIFPSVSSQWLVLGCSLLTGRKFGCYCCGFGAVSGRCPDSFSTACSTRTARRSTSSI